MTSWILSLAMFAVLALIWGGAKVWCQQGDRKRGSLMLIAAAVLLGNVLILAWP